MLLLSDLCRLRHALIELGDRLPHGLRVSIFVGQLILVVVLDLLLVASTLGNFGKVLPISAQS